MSVSTDFLVILVARPSLNWNGTPAFYDNTNKRATKHRVPEPRGSRSQQVQDGIHRRPNVGLARSSAGLGWRVHWLQPPTLRIPQVARIASSSRLQIRAAPPSTSLSTIALRPISGGSCHP